MSIELAEKIKALARIALEAQSITKDMKKAFEVRSDSLEARVKALEAGMPAVIPESIVKRVVEQMRDRIPVKDETAVDVPEKRGRGRPKKNG